MNLSQPARIALNKAIDSALDNAKDSLTFEPHIADWSDYEIGMIGHFFWHLIDENEELTAYFKQLRADEAVKQLDAYSLNAVNVDSFDALAVSNEVLRNHEWLAVAVHEYKRAA